MVAHPNWKEGTIYTAPDCDLRRRWIKWLFELRLADLAKSTRDKEVM